MIEKFAGARGLPLSEFLDLNHTSNSMFLVSLMIPKFARNMEFSTGERRNRATSMAAGGSGSSRIVGSVDRHAGNEAWFRRARATQLFPIGTISSMNQPVDPITVSVIQHRLRAIVEEMGEAM